MGDRIGILLRKKHTHFDPSAFRNLSLYVQREWLQNAHPTGVMREMTTLMRRESFGCVHKAKHDFEEIFWAKRARICVMAR